MRILLLFANIRQLTFYESSFDGAEYLSFTNQFPTFSSSTLVELRINTYRLDDCLLLLDGRLSQLCRLFLTTFYILPLQSTNIRQVN